MRALAWEFRNNPSLASADRQFLLGSLLMIVPVLVQGATSVDGVFPGFGKGEVWYDWYNQSAIVSSSGQKITIDAFPGYILGLLAATSLEGTAKGNLYVDDGESIKPNATLFVEFSLTQSTLYASARGTYKDSNPLANVTIMGVPSMVSNVTLNGAALPSRWAYNGTTRVAVKSAGF
ncbi:hypothetical protein BKA61DRAFT_676169 [Leptodontidium sp. MPI-SDFR-AT-0119]|nr:hypothetical protein BKA61DRAFT_676169 [Leptodontidium sp. MPI-SDFR-AT-0119]